MKKKLLIALACLSMLQSNQTMPMWASLGDRLSSGISRMADRLSNTTFNERAGIAGVVAATAAIGIAYLLRSNSQKTATIEQHEVELQRRQTNIEQLQSAIRTIMQQVRNLKGEFATLRDGTAACLEKHEKEVVDRAREQLGALKDRLDATQAALQEMETKHPGEVASLKAAYTSQLDEAQDMLARLKEQVEAQEATIHEKNEEHATLREQHEARLADLQRQFEKERTDLEAQKTTKIAQCKADATEEIAGVQKHYEEQIAELNARFTAEREALIKRFQKMIMACRTEAQSIRETLGALRAEVSEGFTNLAAYAQEKFGYVSEQIAERFGHIRQALLQFSNPRFNPFTRHVMNPNFMKLTSYHEALQTSGATCLKNSRNRKSLNDAQLAKLAAEGEAAEKDPTEAGAAATGSKKPTGITPSMISKFTITNRTEAETKAEEGTRPQKILLISVHGTWAANSGEFGSGDNRLSTAFKTFAQELSLATGADVDFFVYQWKGWNTLFARQEGGEHLAKFIKDYYADNRSHDIVSWLVGHSHGGNVINYAAQGLKDSGIKIDNAVMIATPVLEDNPHAEGRDGTYNISSITNIWGDTDMTGTAGSILTSASTWFGGSRAETSTTTTLRHRHSHDPTEIMRNIRLKFDSQYLNHITIKHVAVRFLPFILKEISDNYATFYDFVFNIAPVTRVTGGDGSGRSIQSVTGWTIHSSIEKDVDVAWKLINEAPQYTHFVPRAVQAAYLHSRDYAETQEAAFTEQYRGYKLHGKPWKGHNILQEVGSAVSGNAKLYAAIYGE